MQSKHHFGLLIGLLGLALAVALIPATVGADQLTRYEVIDDWIVECESAGVSDDESCTIRSGPHVARTSGEISGFTLSVSPALRAVAIESAAALGLEAKVDGGEIFSTTCADAVCSFSKRESTRLLAQMRSGRVMVARMVTPNGEVNRSFTLDPFRIAFENAKQSRRAFAGLRLSQVELLAVQSLLSDRGYDPGPRDGIAGPKTRKAIMAYQRDNALKPDGQPRRAILYHLRSEN